MGEGMKRPDEAFRGKSWDENGNPVDPDKSPGLVTLMPLLALAPGEEMPFGVGAHLLGGNYYGSGPEIVLWDGLSEMHVSFPLWDRKQLPLWLNRLKKAGERKKRDPIGCAKLGGVWVNS
jgi:hypothetical protein